MYVYVFDPSESDKLSKVRGIGRYMQILRENFPHWIFTNNVTIQQFNPLRQSVSEASNKTIYINPFFNFLSSPLLIRRKFPKQIAVIHDLIPLKYPEYFPIGLKGNISVLLNRMALLNYDVVITDSAQSKKDIIAILHIPENKVKVVYPCLPRIFGQKNLKSQKSNLKTISQNSKINKDISNYRFDICNLTFELQNKYCLYVGDATWNKNLVNLAKAIKMQELPCVFVGKVFSTPNSKFKTLNPNQTPNLKIQNDKRNILGFDFSNLFRIYNLGFRVSKQNRWNDELNEFMSLAKDDKRFIFPGYISDEELIQLYQNALCNILVSRDEGFGFSYLEASSKECPSVLSDIPVLREISNNNALFVDPKNPKSIVSAIQSLQNNDSLRQNLIKQSFKRSTFFSPQSFKNQFLLNF